MTKSKKRKSLPNEPSQKDSSDNSKFSNSRNDIQKAKDRKLIVKLSEQGWSGRDMAEHPLLNHISYRQINDDLKKIITEYTKDSKLAIEKFKVRQNRRLDYVYREMTDSFEGSKLFLRSDPARYDIPDELREEIESIKVMLHKIGNHNYMKIAIEALREQNKIAGAYAPEKVEIKEVEIDWVD